MKWAGGSKTWYTPTGPVKERIPPKLTPWVTQATLTRRVTAVVIEVCGDQPEGDVEVHLHAIIVFSHLACRWHNNVMWAFGRAAAGHFANTLILCECSTYFIHGYILPDTYFIHGYTYIYLFYYMFIYIYSSNSKMLWISAMPLMCYMCYSYAHSMPHTNISTTTTS